jgi:hypothetical protein
MLKIDLGVCILFLMPLFFWSRGIWRRDKSDVALSLVVFVVSVLMYARLYPFTSLVGVPWIFLLCFSLVAAVVTIVRRAQGLGKAFLIAGIIVPTCLSALLFIGERQWAVSSNSLMVITPYRFAGTWVFDDPRVGLKAEPFVSGTPELIDRLVADAQIENADTGFRLLFSLRPFPGCQTKMVWRRREAGGNWYYSEKYKTEGWLCPALFKYFNRAPKEIYVKAEAQKSSIEVHGN